MAERLTGRRRADTPFDSLPETGREVHDTDPGGNHTPRQVAEQVKHLRLLADTYDGVDAEEWAEAADTIERLHKAEQVARDVRKMYDDRRDALIATHQALVQTRAALDAVTSALLLHKNEISRLKGDNTSPRTEYRVTWQRQDEAKKRAFYQTRKGAEACAERQRTARGDMDWLDEPVAKIVYGPVIEHRDVGLWAAEE